MVEIDEIITVLRADAKPLLEAVRQLDSTSRSAQRSIERARNELHDIQDDLIDPITIKVDTELEEKSDGSDEVTVPVKVVVEQEQGPTEKDTITDIEPPAQSIEQRIDMFLTEMARRFTSSTSDRNIRSSDDRSTNVDIVGGESDDDIVLKVDMPGRTESTRDGEPGKTDQFLFPENNAENTYITDDRSQKQETSESLLGENVRESNFEFEIPEDQIDVDNSTLDSSIVKNFDTNVVPFVQTSSDYADDTEKYIYSKPSIESDQFDTIKHDETEPENNISMVNFQSNSDIIDTEINDIIHKEDMLDDLSVIPDESEQRLRRDERHESNIDLDPVRNLDVNVQQFSGDSIESEIRESVVQNNITDTSVNEFQGTSPDQSLSNINEFTDGSTIEANMVDDGGTVEDGSNTINPDDTTSDLYVPPTSQDMKIVQINDLLTGMGDYVRDIVSKVTSADYTFDDIRNDIMTADDVEKIMRRQLRDLQ